MSEASMSGEVDLDSPIGCRHHPGSHVGVVIEATQEDPISRYPGASNGPAERKGEGRHIRAKDNLIRPTAKQISPGRPG
jgi:hypothetical protein